MRQIIDKQQDIIDKNAMDVEEVDNENDEENYLNASF